MRFEQIVVLDWLVVGVFKWGKDLIWLGVINGDGICIVNIFIWVEVEEMLKIFFD